MTISLLQQGGVVALGFDAATNERGFLVKMINRTGGASVKGTLLAASVSTDREVIKQANEYDTIAVVQESGVAEGSEMWCWMPGSVCQMLLKDSVTAAQGEVALAADTDGRMDRTTNPGGGLPGTDTHFKEVGHVLQDVTGGTDQLCLVAMHCN
jgi:hypothetical protein